MTRIKLTLPQHFQFETQMEVRISDLNYGNHLSNDRYLSYLHEARMRFLSHFGYTEMDLGGASVIMGDSALVYKRETHYGDTLRIEIAAADFGARSFDLYYRLTNAKTGDLVCEAKTGMVCYDYETLKTVDVPEAFRMKFEPFQKSDT